MLKVEGVMVVSLTFTAKGNARLLDAGLVEPRLKPVVVRSLPERSVMDTVRVGLTLVRLTITLPVAPAGRTAIRLNRAQAAALAPRTLVRVFMRIQLPL